MKRKRKNHDRNGRKKEERKKHDTNGPKKGPGHANAIFQVDAFEQFR